MDGNPLGDQFPVIEGEVMGFMESEVFLSTKNKGVIMPITKNEAQTIKEIVSTYIRVEDAKEMFKELTNDVAHVTENDSVKQSILMLNSLYSE